MPFSPYLRACTLTGQAERAPFQTACASGAQRSCRSCKETFTLPTLMLCVVCEARRLTLTHSFTATITPWVVYFARDVFSKVTFRAAPALEIPFAPVTLKMFRAFCRYLTTLPGGHMLSAFAKQTKGWSCGKQIEFFHTVSNPETTESLLQAGFRDVSRCQSTMIYYPEKKILSYLTSPLNITFKMEKDALYGKLIFALDVTTWAEDGEFYYGEAAGWTRAAQRLVEERMRVHAKGLSSRCQLPELVLAKMDKMQKRQRKKQRAA